MTRVSLHGFYLLVFAVGCTGARIGGATRGGASALPEAAPAVAAVAPLRRLTQEQYRNSVRDLLGVRDLTLDLPVDEGTAGFFANTLAPVSELHLEKYGRAAEVVARVAVLRLPQILSCDPRGDEAACATRFVTGFGRRAYRRPLSAEEIADYQALYRFGRDESDFAGGIRLVVQAMLQSPHFLYLVEPGAVAGSERSQPVSQLALASRLSYFLWNSTPDEALLTAAEHGQLDTRAAVQAETARMLRDPRFADTVASFHLQWLDLTELGGVEKRGKIYPLYSPELRAAMQEETVRFADEVVRHGDGRLDTLLAGRFSVLGGPLFELYGLGTRVGRAADWQRVELTEDHRAGLLTQASVLAVHAHWDSPSLVLRGKLVRERLFCQVLPPPPPTVNNTPPPADPKTSARARFEEHRNDFGCSKCHNLIDPLGIPFESYDGIGAYRTLDGPQPVDPASEIEGTARTNGKVKDAIELAAKLATSDEVRDCVALQWFRFALGRDEEPEDAPSLGQIRRVFRTSGYQIPSLVSAITSADSFRYERATP